MPAILVLGPTFRAKTAEFGVLVGTPEILRQALEKYHHAQSPSPAPGGQHLRRRNRPVYVSLLYGAHRRLQAYREGKLKALEGEETLCEIEAGLRP